MNPKYDFYLSLMTFFHISPTVGSVLNGIAANLVKTYNSNRGEITLPNVTVENLMAWHVLTQPEVTKERPDESSEVRSDVAIHSFQDLAPQMRNPAVRALHLHTLAWSNLPGHDYFAHIRRVKHLGNGFAVVTIVTDNFVQFEHALDGMEKGVYGHLSRSTKCEDQGDKTPDLE